MTASADQLRVLRLCSVFEPAEPSAAERAAYDPIGGMQNHTAALTRALDARGVVQHVVTSRLAAPAGTSVFGNRALVERVGLPVPALRQGWALSARRAAQAVGPVDLVHAPPGEDLALLPLARAEAARRGVPLVVTVHCSLAHSLPANGVRLRALRLVGGALERRALAAAAQVVVLTDTAARQAPELGDRVTVIPSGVETRSFAGAAPSPLLEDVPRPRIGYLGRLARQKDVPTLVRAFGRTASDASLVLVGDGPDRPAVDAAVAGLPARKRGRLRRHGFRPHDEIPGLLAGLDVLVLPSVYEEMGSVLAEALHAGVPVVATRVGGIPDVVVDGVTGVLVEPGDDAAMAAAIDGLLARPDRLRAMGEASRRRAAGYDWDDLAARTLAVYDAALACTSSNTSASRSAV